MTDPEWTEAWLRAWRSFPGAGDANPWTAMLDHFSNDLSASYPQPLADALDRITEQSRAFFDLGQALAADGGEGRQDAVFRYLDGVAARLRDPEAAGRALGGVSPLVYWRQFAGDGGESPSDHQTLMSQLEQLLRMPGLGPTRERQESVRELSRLWLDYEHAYGEYAAYCAETARRSVERLRERLKEAFAAGGGPASVRALYDEWVACSEEVYAERTATSDYMRLHGRLVNTLMAYRRQAAGLLDQWAEAANLPSRREVDALHRKLKDTRRALRALEARTAEPQQKKRKKKAAKKKAAKKKATKKKTARKKTARKKTARKKRAGQQ